VAQVADKERVDRVVVRVAGRERVEEAGKESAGAARPWTMTRHNCHRKPRRQAQLYRNWDIWLLQWAEGMALGKAMAGAVDKAAAEVVDRAARVAGGADKAARVAAQSYRSTLPHNFHKTLLRPPLVGRTEDRCH